MKLLHRVVKSSQGVNVSGTVSIDNTVVIKKKLIDDIGPDKNLTEEEFLARIQAYEKNLMSDYELKMKQAEIEKDRIICDAQNLSQKIQNEAVEIVNKAKEEAVAIKEEARQSGYSQGYEEGRQAAYNDLASEFAAVRQIIEQLNSEREAIYIQNENDLIDLAYDMAKKITLSEIKTDKSIIFEIVKQACKTFRNSDRVKISLAKCDMEQSVVTDEKLIKRIAGNIPEVEIELLQDAQSGTVILDDNEEIVDASVPTQLDFLKEVLNASKKIIE